jgi:DNA-binding LytR/AlgR family response regulator
MFLVKLHSFIFFIQFQCFILHWQYRWSSQRVNLSPMKKLPVQSRLVRKFPQNYLLRNPVSGGLIFSLFGFLFVLAYRPLDTGEALGLTYVQTMAIYCALVGVAAMGLLKLIKTIDVFSAKTGWNFLKEVAAIFLVLTGTGTVIYFAAFFIEPPADRWNLATFFDSLRNAYLIGLLPFALFTLANIQYLVASRYVPAAGQDAVAAGEAPPETPILINSRLKKEKLVFPPSRMIYAEAEGNYIAFFLETPEGVKKRYIRNSMNNVEAQLADIPFLFRTHRAFMVNLDKITHSQGNAAGYRLRLKGTDAEIPVSRQNVRIFEQKVRPPQP